MFYIIITGRLCTCVIVPLRNIFDFSVISKVWNSKKTAIQTIFYYYSTKTAKNHVLVTKTRNNSRFANSTHKHNWLTFIYYVGMHYRKVKQRMSSHLSTNSRLLKFSKYKNKNLGKLYELYNFDLKFVFIKYF